MGHDAIEEAAESALLQERIVNSTVTTVTLFLSFFCFPLKPKLDFCVTANQEIYRPVIWRRLHSCCMYISVNVNVLPRGCSNNKAQKIWSDQPIGMQDTHLHITLG